MVAAPCSPRSPRSPRSLLLPCLLVVLLLPITLIGQKPSGETAGAPSPTLATDAERETFLKKARG